MKYKVVGWIDYSDGTYPDSAKTPSVKRAVTSELREKGYTFSAVDHHERSACCPLLNDGTAARFSWREWGEVMACAAHPEGVDRYAYMEFYADDTGGRQRVFPPPLKEEMEEWAYSTPEELAEKREICVDSDTFKEISEGRRVRDVQLADEAVPVDEGDYIIFKEKGTQATVTVKVTFVQYHYKYARSFQEIAEKLESGEFDDNEPRPRKGDGLQEFYLFERRYTLAPLPASFYGVDRESSPNSDEFVYVGNVIVRYKGDSEVVTIPNGVATIARYAFYGAQSIKKIILPESVIRIGLSAFHNCFNLEEIVLGATTRVISNSAFCGCRKLKSINIPDGLREIGGWTFVGCESLEEIVLGENVKKIGHYAFFNCKGLKRVVFNEKLKAIGRKAFGYCRGLTEAELDDEQARVAEDAFYRCSSLEGADVKRKPDFSLDSEVTEADIDEYMNWVAFTFDCEYERKMSLPDEFIVRDGILIKYEKENDTAEIGEEITKVGDYAFYGCGILKEVKIPETVREIGAYSFCGCSLLDTVDIPDSVKKIGRGAFFMTALSELVVPVSCKIADDEWDAANGKRGKVVVRSTRS